MEIRHGNTTAKAERAASPTPRSPHRHRQQRDVTPRASSGPTRERKKGHDPKSAPPLRSCRSGGGSSGRTARTTEQAAETQRSARSAGSAASLYSLRDGRGLQMASDSNASTTGRGGLFSDRTTARSLGGASSVAGLTDCSTVAPRETSRTTTTMAMSTARAEATLAVLEAERAQLEHRLKKVEDELRQEQLLTMKQNRKHGGKRRTVR